MTVHIAEPNGAAKCGANVYRHFEYVGDKRRFIEKRISTRKLLYFENAEKGIRADCRRCLNTVVRSTKQAIAGNMVGKLFHRSFGYDMTINVFAVCIAQGDKSLTCIETVPLYEGYAWEPGGNGKASPSAKPKEDAKPFKMYLMASEKRTHLYWAGDGEHWSVCEPAQSFYENRCD